MSLSEELFTALKRATSSGLAALIVTGFALGALTLVLTIAAYFVAGGGKSGAIAAAIALVVGGAATVFGAIKRAIGKGLAAALESAGLGAKLADAVFARLGDPTKPVALPEATTRLHRAIGEIARSDLANSWVGRRVGGRALEGVQSVTSSRFAERVTPAGTVDLAAIHVELRPVIDNLVLGRVADATQLATILALAIVVAGGLVPAFVLRSYY